MKELSSRIVVSPLFTKMQSERYVFMADSVSLQPSLSDSSAGCIYNYSKDYIIDKPNARVLAEFKITRSCNITLTDSDGDSYSFGSKSYPAKITIVPTLQKCTLKLEYSAPSPI